MDKRLLEYYLMEMSPKNFANIKRAVRRKGWSEQVLNDKLRPFYLELKDLPDDYLDNLTVRRFKHKPEPEAAKRNPPAIVISPVFSVDNELNTYLFTIDKMFLEVIRRSYLALKPKDDPNIFFTDESEDFKKLMRGIKEQSAIYRGEKSSYLRAVVAARAENRKLTHLDYSQ